MKIAIVGGTGFIGSYLVKDLSKIKKVKLVATFNKSKPPFRKKNIKWIKLNLRQKRKNFYKYLKYPEILINLSWSNIPNYMSSSHYKIYKYQKNLIENLVKNGLKNLLVLGTCFEYGNIEGKISEKKTPNPITPYAKSKLKLLKSMIKLQKKQKYNLSWLRLFYVYGYNSKRNTLYNLVKKFEINSKKELLISGNLVRDYISISDLVKIIRKISFLKQNTGIVNVCSGKPISLKEFCYKILSDKRKIKKINFTNKKKNNYEPFGFWGNNKKLKKLMS